MFDKAWNERKKLNRKIEDAKYYFYPPTPYESEYNNVVYKICEVYDMKYIHWDSMYKGLGYYEVLDYTLIGDNRTLDLTFLNPADIIELNINEDVDSINIKSSNIRYADFNISGSNEKVVSPVKINIDVDTNCKDLLDSLYIFVRDNKMIFEVLISINFENINNKILQNKIRKSLMSYGIPDSKISFELVQEKEKNKIRIK